MSAERPEQEFRKFEVYLPVDGPEATVAAQGIQQVVHLAGGHMHEVETESAEITTADILSLSQDVYGSPHYGEFAISLLDTLRRAATAQVLTQGRNIYVDFAFSPYHFGTDQGMSIAQPFGPASMCDQQIEERIRALLPDTKSPFDYIITPASGRAGHYLEYDIRMNVVPTRLSKNGLHRFLAEPERDRNDALNLHGLHGVLGRGIDLLCAVSGAKESLDPTITEGDEAFMQLGELRSYLKEAGVSSSRRTTVHYNLRNFFRSQMQYGHNELAQYEVVAEGNTTVGETGFYSAINLDLIAFSTLRAIGERATDPILKDCLSVF